MKESSDGLRGRVEGKYKEEREGKTQSRNSKGRESYFAAERGR